MGNEPGPHEFSDKNRQVRSNSSHSILEIVKKLSTIVCYVNHLKIIIHTLLTMIRLPHENPTLVKEKSKLGTTKIVYNKSVKNRPRLLEAWLALTSVKYHGNL